MMENDKLTEKIIATCYNVHTKLGPGFNERIYLNALKFAFKEVKLKYDSEKTYPVFFKNNLVGKLRVDLVIENKVIIEIKSVQGIIPKIFEAQLISYLKASGLKVGLLVNFGERRCQIRRLILSP